jgi:hypothetical protein
MGCLQEGDRILTSMLTRKWASGGCDRSVGKWLQLQRSMKVGMGEKWKGVRLGIEVPGKFTHQTNIDLDQALAFPMWFRQGEQNHPVTIWSK